MVCFGDVVKVVHAAVCAHGPDGFVFKPRGLVFLLLVIIDLGTLNNAALVTVVFGFAFAFHDDIMHGFTGDLLVAVKLAAGKVPGRQRSCLVDNVDQDIGAICAERLGDGVVDQGLGEGAVGLCKFFLVNNFHFGVSGLDDDTFHPF